MRAALALIALIAALSAAHAFGLGEGNRFGRLGAMNKGAAGAAPGSNGDILMVDGTSLILQTDGASFVCRAGGC